MGKCKKCGRSGLFLRVNKDGLCSICADRERLMQKAFTMREEKLAAERKRTQNLIDEIMAAENHKHQESASPNGYESVTDVVNHLLSDGRKVASRLQMYMTMSAKDNLWGMSVVMAQTQHLEITIGRYKLLDCSPLDTARNVFFWGIDEERTEEERNHCADILDEFSDKWLKINGTASAVNLRMLALAYSNEMMRGIDIDDDEEIEAEILELTAQLEETFMFE